MKMSTNDNIMNFSKTETFVSSCNNNLISNNKHKKGRSSDKLLINNTIKNMNMNPYNYLQESSKTIKTQLNKTNNNIINFSEIYIRKLMRATNKKLVKSSSKKFDKKKLINCNKFPSTSQLLYCNNNSKNIFTIYPDENENKILCFDPDNKQFQFHDLKNFEYVDNSNTNDNNKNNNETFPDYNNSLLLVHDNIIYIVTGENSNIFYNYNPSSNKLIRLNDLKNNHTNGALLYYDNKIFCLSGEENKSVELYSVLKNNWEDLPEMNIERSSFSCCIIKDKYLFALFGYNKINNQYLDSIEYFDISNYLFNNQNNNQNFINEWKNLNYINTELVDLNFTKFLSFNFCDEKIFLYGGYNGKENAPVENLYEIKIGNNFDKNFSSSLNIIVKSDKKLKDIEKNGCYYFENSYESFIDENNNVSFVAFDSNFQAHLFDIHNFTHNIYYLG